MPWLALSSARPVWSRSTAALPVFSVLCCCSGYCDRNRPQARAPRVVSTTSEVALAYAFAIRLGTFISVAAFAC